MTTNSTNEFGPDDFRRPEDIVDTGRDSTSKAYFDDYFRDKDDPWRLDSSWYERRKREILLATLPAERYGRVFEIGSAKGAITERLLDRADHILAVDISDAAIEQSRERLGDDPRVTLQRATLPAEWPEGRFDLIVMSEVGYYMSSADLVESVDRMVGSLADGGVLIACHYRPENTRTEAPISGEFVHAQIAARDELEQLVRHIERFFLIEAYRRRPRA